MTHDKPKDKEINLEEALKFLDNRRNDNVNIDIKIVDNMHSVIQLIALYYLSIWIFFTEGKEIFVEVVRNGSPRIL